MFLKHKELYKHFRENHEKGKNPSSSIASRSKGPQHSKSRKNGHPHATRRPSAAGQGPSNISPEDKVDQDEREEPFSDMKEGTSYAMQLEPPVNSQTRCRQTLDVKQTKISVADRCSCLYSWTQLFHSIQWKQCNDIIFSATVIW
jgi:hypothetical protein